MKTYLVRFGQSNPTSYSGLAPTFTVFSNPTGLTTAAAPPGITESPSGSGLYYFGFTATTFPIMFKIDGSPTGTALAPTDRYIVGLLDPLFAVDEKLGWLSDSFGSTAADPSSVLGYLKRNLEVNEGTASFNSSTGLWVVLSRAVAAGVTMVPVAFFNHALVNNSGSVTKS
jgi:hypothetical protein